MGFFKKNKPRKGNVGISDGRKIIYACKTQVLDKVIIERAGKRWDQDMADAMDRGEHCYYFLVRDDLTYNVIALKESQTANLPIYNIPPDPNKQPQSRSCFEHYIKNSQ